MDKKLTTMREASKGFANAMNLITPEIPDHHQRVGYFAYMMADEMGYDDADKLAVIYVSIFYNAGLTVLPELDAEGRKIKHSFNEIVDAGVHILGNVPKLADILKIMNTCEEPSLGWDDEAKKAYTFNRIIFLADTVSKLLKTNKAVLNQISDISEDITEMAGSEIPSEVAEAFMRITEKEYVWMNLLHQPEIFLEFIPANLEMSIDDTIEYARIMSRIIDYRSSYTAMHSSGVVVPAVRLAELIGMSEEECKMIMIAGYLHDIGKLTIPKSILDKSGKLTDEEYNIVKEHAYYTYLLLKDIKGFEQISKWASLHHEKLNGTGYPFGYQADDIPMGARIMAVADIFSAVAEIRPYREGMSKDQVVEILRSSASTGALSSYIVDLLVNNYEDIYEKRDIEVRNEGARYYAAIVDSE